MELFIVSLCAFLFGSAIVLAAYARQKLREAEKRRNGICTR